jgi:hypothetical protein
MFSEVRKSFVMRSAVAEGCLLGTGEIHGVSVFGPPPLAIS